MNESPKGIKSNFPNSAHISNLVYQMVIKPLLFVQPQLRTIQAMFPNYTLTDYDSLERNADAGFYSTSPLLGQVMPRLPNTVNVGFIHCRYMVCDIDTAFQLIWSGQGRDYQLRWASGWRRTPGLSSTCPWAPYIRCRRLCSTFSHRYIHQNILWSKAMTLFFLKVFEKLPLRVIWKRKDKLITNKFYQVFHLCML